MGTPRKYSTPEEKRAANTANSRRWREKYPEKVQAITAARRRPTSDENRCAHFRKAYGMTLAEVEQRLIDQGHKCPICDRNIALRRGHRSDAAVVDHCHASGKVRGIICQKCNVGLGSFQDRKDALLAAAAYLQAHEDVAAILG